MALDTTSALECRNLAIDICSRCFKESIDRSKTAGSQIAENFY